MSAARERIHQFICISDEFGEEVSVALNTWKTDKGFFVHGGPF